MTQKELLYVEDAIEHEKSIIQICKNYLKDLDENDNLVFFVNKQINEHEKIKCNLMELLKELYNE